MILGCSGCWSEHFCANLLSLEALWSTIASWQQSGNLSWLSFAFQSHHRTLQPRSASSSSIHWILDHAQLTAWTSLQNPEIQYAAVHRISRHAAIHNVGGWPGHHCPWRKVRTIHMQDFATCKVQHFISCFCSGLLGPMGLFYLPLLPVSCGSRLFGKCCSLGSYLNFWCRSSSIRAVHDFVQGLCPSGILSCL